MDKFTTLTGVAVPINMTHIDTDRIIPKNYLKTIKRTGLGKALFAEMRYDLGRAARYPSSSSTRGPSARRPSWWLARTSAAGRAASTRRGRCSTSASAA